MPQTKKNEIIIAGQRFAVGEGEVTVLTWEDPGGYSFPAKKAEAMAKTGSPLFLQRTAKGVGHLDTYEKVVENVDKIIIHTDLTSDSRKCFDVLLSRGLSTHFMIDWDGTIYQGVDVQFQAFHAGEQNNVSIGIDFNNRMKNLLREPSQGPYNPKHERFGEMMKKEFKRPVSPRMKINGSKVKSYGYTDAQYLSLIELLKVLTKRFKKIKPEFPMDAKGEVIPQILDDFAAFNGFMGHWHMDPSRWDPGPGFDWQRVFHALGSEHNSFPVELSKGKNIKTLLVPQKVKAYAEEYYANIELKGAGGWYPIGINQTWHGGVHLAVPRGTPVRAMFDGVLVAARFGKQPTTLGHNNFILLKHTIPIPVKNKGAEPKKFIFYSLYMHLEQMDVATVTDESPKWVKELYRIDSGSDDEEEAEDLGEGEEDGEEDGFDEGDGLDEGDEDEVDASEVDTKTVWLKVGEHTAGLKSGKVAKIEYVDAPINVLSGDIIGKSGMFGPADDWSPQVHVEVFADEGWKQAIDIGVHGAYLTELDDDVGHDLFVENSDILNVFGKAPAASRTSMVPQRVVKPSDIEGFWTAEGEYVEEKRWMRKLITRHVSEWSDQVDWVMALSKAESWDERLGDFRKILRKSSLSTHAIATIAPFTWLSRDIAEHIGLKVDAWNGVLDHFHPIHFLIWMTYHSSNRVQALSSGVSKRALKKALKKKLQQAEKCRLDSTVIGCEGERGEGFGAIYDPDDYVSDVSAGEALDSWFNAWDQGEWKREDRETEDE